MANFKVYLTIKGSSKEEEIRRFTINPDVATNFLYLKEKLHCVFPIVCGKRFTISWIDTEGDQIAISSDEELRIAIREFPESTNYKLYIVLHPDHEKDLYVQPEEVSGILHQHIICDGCNKNVKGFRYKCMECTDYDLCSECEAKGLHPEHCMLRIPVPLQWTSRHGRRLAHHMKKFLRTSPAYSGRDENARKCPVMKERHHGKPRPNCDSFSWVDTFADYFNDWTNYTGECPMKYNVSKPPETATEATASSNGPQPQETKKEAQPHVDILKIVEDNIAQLLNPLGIDISVRVKDNEKSDETPNNAPTKQDDSKVPPTTNENVFAKFPGEGRKLMEEKILNNPTSNIEPLANKDSSPSEKSGKSSDDDEWTILNKEAIATAGSATPQTSAQPSSSLKPTNENVPQAIITPSAPVGDQSNQNLYPPLPKATITTPHFYHPNPKIQRAVESMMGMGFSNEGGWLTHLLVAKDGDIDKVLDTLSSVQK